MGLKDILDAYDNSKDLDKLFKSNNEILSKNEAIINKNIILEPTKITKEEQQKEDIPPIIKSSNDELSITNKYLEKFNEEVNESPTEIPHTSNVTVMGSGLGIAEANRLIKENAKEANFNNGILSATNINDAIVEVYNYTNNLNSTNIFNVSNVSGNTVTNALDHIHNELQDLALSAGAVTSVFGRASAIIAQSGDYNSAQVIHNASNVSASLISISANFNNYYNSTQVNNISATLYQQLSADNNTWPTVSASYYNSTQIDTLLNTKASSAVSALINNNSNSIAAISANLQNNYYTNIQINSLFSATSAILNNNISAVNNSLSAYAVLNNSATFSATNIGNISVNSYMKVEPTGFLQLYGSACVWDDITMPAASINPAGGGPDAAILDNEDSSILFRGNSTDTVACWFQLPHGYKVGSNIYVHIHWTRTVANAGVPNWQIKHKEGPISGTITNFSPFLSGVPSVDSSAINFHNIFNFAGAISGTTSAGQQLNISSLVCVYLQRVTPDAYGNNNAKLCSIDLHIQKDTYGSRQEFSKL